MKIEPFGKALIETGDLDPVYVAIHGAKLPKNQLARLLLAYWCFYHLGVAAWLSEFEDDGPHGRDYWHFMKVAAANRYGPNDPKMHWEHGHGVPAFDRWPRGTERRHFRGDKCVKAVEYISRLSVNKWVARIPIVSFGSIVHIVQSWPLFGPWIAYKAADMLDRCAGYPIEFPLDVCLLYDEPRKGLLMLNPTEPEKELQRLLKVFGKFKAPPANDRACGVQEVETILCKAKASWSGKYWVGKDIHEIRHGLGGWGDTAATLLAHSPKEVVRIGSLL